MPPSAEKDLDSALPPAAELTEGLDTSFLESLVGYNARRAVLQIIELFISRMTDHDMRPVQFSVMSLIARNPGITSRQLCDVLGMMSSNLVAMVRALEKRKLISRKPHPNDGRATGLYPTRAGTALVQTGEKTISALEIEATSGLTSNERQTLIRLLKKIYLSPSCGRV
ncbi:MAG: MarR family winged helix-turn-helix transcriptional regulator [Pseudomonadota bacterium]